MLSYHGRLILSVLVMAGLTFSSALGIYEFNHAKSSKRRLTYGLLSVFSLISMILVSNLI
ncbi:hypothetical protein K5V21_13930 [Clostridium sardiniense]|uniref:DUF3953 domain-containing protein n=1 Tax=Clostridium sardiniense TaxID=29369 RepID=A0ABS7L111_CLOSR|nr:hypothetical protein [Clostridium sardiniense]MBY0756543.1 hypothetical protein [Clostridium sardiniense]MDQ0460292.1 hypothetical protein [Clostridium sardiniense]